MSKIVRARPIQVHTTQEHTARLEHVAATLATLAEEIKELQSPPAKMPRGTRDLILDTGKALAALPLRDRIRDVLRANTFSHEEVAKALGATNQEVRAEILAAAKEGLVANVGAEDFPMWVWRIGDETSAAELTAVVRRLITERPMTTKELVHATGARMTRVGGAVVAVQRSGEQIMDLNPKTRAGRWFLVLPEARDARLQPKPPKG